MGEKIAAICVTIVIIGAIVSIILGIIMLITWDVNITTAFIGAMICTAFAMAIGKHNSFYENNSETKWEDKPENK